MHRATPGQASRPFQGSVESRNSHEPWGFDADIDHAEGVIESLARRVSEGAQGPAFNSDGTPGTFCVSISAGTSPRSRVGLKSKTRPHAAQVAPPPPVITTPIAKPAHPPFGKHRPPFLPCLAFPWCLCVLVVNQTSRTRCALVVKKCYPRDLAPRHRMRLVAC
jgi:hypothetical protein